MITEWPSPSVLSYQAAAPSQGHRKMAYPSGVASTHCFYSTRIGFPLIFCRKAVNTEAKSIEIYLLK